jgi:hypothetical protein
MRSIEGKDAEIERLRNESAVLQDLVKKLQQVAMLEVGDHVASSLNALGERKKKA